MIIRITLSFHRICTCIWIVRTYIHTTDNLIVRMSVDFCIYVYAYIWIKIRSHVRYVYVRKYRLSTYLIATIYHNQLCTYVWNESKLVNIYLRVIKRTYGKYIQHTYVSKSKTNSLFFLFTFKQESKNNMLYVWKQNYIAHCIFAMYVYTQYFFLIF